MTSPTPSVPPVQLSAALVSYAADAPDGWETMLDTARLYDRVGIDRLVVSDHVVFGEQLDAYGRPEVGGQRGGRQPTGPDGHWLEPMTALSVIAGITEHVRLATGILLAALRRPVVLAKTAATLDVLSRGRLDLGVGVGWQREEYEAAGLDFDRRGRLLDHTLEVCTALWTEPVAHYQSSELGLRANPHDAETAAAGRRADLGERPDQRAGRRPALPIRAAVDPVGRRRRRIWSDRSRSCASGSRPTGVSPDDLQVVANLRIFKTDDGTDRRRPHDGAGAASRRGRRDRPTRAIRARRTERRDRRPTCTTSSPPFGSRPGRISSDRGESSRPEWRPGTSRSRPR